MNPLLALLILFDLEGLASLIWALVTPSESGGELWLWFSGGRLLLSAVLLLIWVAMLAVTLRLWRSKDRVADALQRLDTWCIDQKQLGATLIPLFVVPILMGAATLLVLRTPLEFAAYRSWAPDTFPLLHSIVRAALPLLLLLSAVAVEAAFFLTLRYHAALVAPDTWALQRTGPSLLLLLISLCTAAHWLILGFQLRLFVSIRAWYWKFDPLPFAGGDLWFALGAAGFFALGYWLLILKRRIVLGLCAVFLLGWFLQIGVGMMGGGGVATLRARYFSTYHQAYVVQASRNDLPILDVIQRYEELYGSSAFTSTKPPGLMAFYIGLEQLINGYPSRFSGEVRYERLANFVTYSFPPIAAGFVILLYAFARRFLEDASGLAPKVAPLLYVLAPAAVLFSFFADQALYPLVFFAGVWFAVVSIRRESLLSAFALGALLYVAVFFAFSMLPLYVFTGLYLLLHSWPAGSGRRWSQRVWLALAVAAGTVALHLLFVRVLNYNFLPRFGQTMAINHNFDFYLRVGLQPPGLPESLWIRLSQIGNAAWINNLDFAAAIGFPIYILFVVQALRRASRFLRGHTAPGDIILVSLLGSFLVLNLAGTAQGEVPRLWLFWLPMVVILAAFELQPLLERRPSVLVWLALVQLATIILTFHFQDLRM